MKAPNPALLGLDDIIRLLRDQVERAGSQAEWARKNRVNGPDLSSTITGKRPPTKDILRALKLKKVFAYQRGGVTPDPKRLSRIKSASK
jgi:hypothetical protein